jgi:hypothetical protein
MPDEGGEEEDWQQPQRCLRRRPAIGPTRRNQSDLIEEGIQSSGVLPWVGLVLCQPLVVRW